MKSLIAALSHWFKTPQTSSRISSRNLVNVQIDAIGVGLANAASPFLPVFLARLGASSLEVSLLTSMPAVTGFFLALPLGRLIQNQRKVVPWFSIARFLVIFCYAVTGITTFFLPEDGSIKTILIIWAVATIPQTIVNICFSVVMNAVAGPDGRFELMSRRWSILGATTALSVFAVGQLLDIVTFPHNFQTAFIALSVGGLISLIFSSRISIPDQIPLPHNTSSTPLASVKELIHLIWSEKPFLSFVLKRLVFLTGVNIGIPLFPLYFVRAIHASDSWIAIITSSQTAILLFAYFFWARFTRKTGSRWVLIITTMGLSLYPLLTSFTKTPWVIAIIAGASGIFQAGINLVFFDELMKTIPANYSATFVSFSQSMEYVSSIISPLVGSFLADEFGLPVALVISAGVRLVGCALFLFGSTRPDNHKP